MFEDVVKIGKGAYGTVYKAVCKQDGLVVAIKQIEMTSDDEGVACTAVREIGILANLNHKNIVKLISVFHNDKTLMLVFEYCPRDLHHHMKMRPGRLLPIEVVSFSFQLLTAVSYIHSKLIIHRDIKPSNLLINESGVLKLCDFGLARLMDVPCNDLSCDVVTQWYRAPEILLRYRNYGLPSDMWSVGCVIAELAIGQPLFPCDDDHSQLAMIFGTVNSPSEAEWPGVSSMPNYPTRILPYPALRERMKSCDPRLVNLVVDLLQVVPSQRISAADALTYPIFDDITQCN